MALPAGYGNLTIEHMRALGSKKWTTYPDAIGAFVAEMDFGTAPSVVSALQAAVGTESFGYLPAATQQNLALSCAEWQSAQYGWDIAPERIFPIADILQALTVTIEHFTEAGGPVIVPTPAYPPFLSVPRLSGREIVGVPLAMDAEWHWSFDLDALESAFSSSPGALLLLCNPYNPLGRVFTREELVGVAAVVHRHGGRVFSDEVHAPITYPGHRHIPYASLSVETAAHTVTATAASKAWNIAGLKCAQIILTNDDDLARWPEVGVQPMHGASLLGVVANTAAYSAGRAWLAETVDYLDGNRRVLKDLVAEHLPEVGLAAPDGTYLAWLDCRALGIEETPADFFRKHAGVATVDGGTCGRAGDGFVRFNFALSAPVLTEALERMGAALRGV